MITPDSFDQFRREVSGVVVHDHRQPASALSVRLAFAAPAHVENIAPERALAAGVLRQAAADLRRFRNATDAVGREMQADAYSWFVANDTEWPYSFVNVCRILDLSSDAVLDEVLADASASWYSHSRRVAHRVAVSFKVSLASLFGTRRSHSFAAVHS